jgi:hypothetical protein
LNPGVAQAWRSTHIETDLAPLPLDAQGRVPLTLATQQVQTLRLTTPSKP